MEVVSRIESGEGIEVSKHDIGSGYFKYTISIISSNERLEEELLIDKTNYNKLSAFCLCLLVIISIDILILLLIG